MDLTKFCISQNKAMLQPERIKKLLEQTYWAQARTLEEIERSIVYSECVGVYLRQTGEQIAFARVITDYVSMFYLCDVIVDQDYRGEGIGKALVNEVVSDVRFRNLRGLLATRDAHGLYAQFGFEIYPDRYMGRPGEGP